MHAKMFVHQILPRNMGTELVPLVTRYANLLEHGQCLILGIKKIITSWEEATVFIFGRSDLNEAVACIQGHIPNLSNNPRFLPVCYADVVIFVVNDKRLDAYIEDETAEQGPVDERLMRLIHSMKKTQRQVVAA